MIIPVNNRFSADGLTLIVVRHFCFQTGNLILKTLGIFRFNYQFII